MAELVLVANPKRRKRSKGKHRRRKGRMPPGLARYWATHGRGRKRRRRASSHRKRRRSASHHVTHHVKRRRRGNPHRRAHRKHHRRRHSNPTLRGFTGAIMPTVKAGAWGAAGALGLDALWGLVYPRLGTFSTYLDNPYIGFFAKAVGAVTVGKFGGKVARGRGKQMAEGAMTVVAHDFLKSLLVQLAPTIFGSGGAVPLGAYLSGSAPIVGTATIPQAYLPFSGIVPDQFGAYMSGSTGQSGGDNGMYVEDRTGLDPWNG
jgi:hypothetical protein